MKITAEHARQVAADPDTTAVFARLSVSRAAVLDACHHLTNQAKAGDKGQAGVLLEVAARLNDAAAIIGDAEAAMRAIAPGAEETTSARATARPRKARRTNDAAC
ncbi:MAG TPA: hypothetical protein VEH31_08920 [Streptosporangiaceae bacterium]|nr:hypothetical protein [Streptosporangiaceae bacterium]